ncbi:MAG TPA: hypothetical protein VIO61_09920 [Anaerolineaceae bacterium]
MNNGAGPDVETIAETENYQVWRAKEPDEITYHLEFGYFTVHFFEEDWEAFLEQVPDILKENPDADSSYELEFYNGVFQLAADEWAEFQELMHMLVPKK